MIKGRFEPQRGKTEPVGKHINTWEEDLLIWPMFASSWQKAAKCVEKKCHWPIMKMRLW